MIFCPRCTTQNPDGTVSCRACGTPLGALMPRVRIRVVRADGGPETVVPMQADFLTCGRFGDVPLADDPFVTETQARFYFSGGALAVEDLGGGNGVFVRVHQEIELPVGGEIRLGRQRLLIEPIAAPVSGPGETMAWGSPDAGFRFRAVQLLEGGYRGNAFTLKEGDNLIGREAGELTFPTDGFVSGRHALLRVRAARLWVSDLGSSNGTFVRLAAPAFVNPGDQFLVGRQLLRVEIE